MSGIIQQLGLDQTFFVQLAIIAAVFILLKTFYFRPFMRLFEVRHKRTVADHEAAEKLMLEAQSKLEEYKDRLSRERAIAKKDFEEMITVAKKEETSLLTHAREQAKKITQEAAESVLQQREQLKKQLEGDIEGLAKNISEKLLSRKE